MIVSSNDGMDEISISDITYASTLYNGKIEDFEINPEHYGMQMSDKMKLLVVMQHLMQNYQMIYYQRN